MYGNRRRAPTPQPSPTPQPRKGTGHYWPGYWPWWDDYYVWDDYDWYDYDWNDYDDWYYWVYNSAYSKGLGEGRQQGFAHAMNLASQGAPLPPKPVAPTPGNTAPHMGNVYPHSGNVHPGNVTPSHTTTLGI